VNQSLYQKIINNKKIVYYCNLSFLACIIVIISTVYYLFQYSKGIIPNPFPWFYYILPWFHDIIVFEFVHSMNGILFYIPFIFALFVFGWREAIITWIISIIIIMPHVVAYSYGTLSIFNNVLILMVPLLILIVLMLQMRWVRHQKKLMNEREKEHQDHIAQIFKTLENERQRVARELHDDTSQRLWVLGSQIDDMITDETNNVSAKMLGELESTKKTIFHILDDTRRLSFALRPNLLDDLGLISAVRSLVDQLYMKNSIKASFFVNGLESKLSSESEIHIFRIIQEALNNVRRHSKATEVKVTLNYIPDKLIVEVSDNGQGFNLPAKISEFTKGGKSGLSGIQQRVSLLNGTLNINSCLGKGTTISVNIPIQHLARI
jgi:signal transduction histidine kinase